MTTLIPPLMLQERRATHLSRHAVHSCPQMQELEQQFGKYILVPLDIEPIVPNDMEAFRAWFDKHGKPISKRRADAAGGFLTKTAPLFKSISNYPGGVNPIWDHNLRLDMYVKFPELRELVMQLPFDKPVLFSLWSSLRTVNRHRDEGPWNDLPCSFRSMIFDENTEPTLYVSEAVPGQKTGPKHFIQKYEGTNSFAWNNLRAEHGSTWLGKEKILLIVASMTTSQMNMNKYGDLIERSIKKYNDQLLISERELDEFLK